MTASPTLPSSSAATARGPMRYFARYGWPVALGVVCLLLTNAMAQAMPWVIKWMVEAIRAGGPTQRITRLFGLLLALAVVGAGIRILSRMLIFNAGRDAEYDLRRELFHRLCQLDGGFYRAFRIGDLMSRLTNDLASVRALFGPGVLHIANTVFAYAVGLPLMLHIDPGLTLWSLLPYAVLLLGARSFARGIYQRSSEVQSSLATMTANVQENLAGIRELKNHGLEGARAEAFDAASGQYLEQALALSRWRAGLIPFVGLGAGSSIVVALWLGGSRVIAGQLTLGDLVAFNLYLGLLAWPTMAIGWMISLWHRGLASWHRLLEIIAQRSPLEVELDLDLDPAAGEAPGAAVAGGSASTSKSTGTTGDGPGGSDTAVAAVGLEARDLSVSIGDQPVLRQVSFAVDPGTICAVVGRVGCGKTTLAEAICRLLEVPRGALFVGGADVRDQPVAAVRRLVAYAPQSAFLFSLTIEDNIALGLGPEHGLPDDEVKRRIREAVTAAGLEPDLDSFPRGLRTEVGERGISLSGGQRQRIALARALVSPRPLLVLDDSLSSVDAETEKRILHHLRDVLRGRTAILISHRLSALQHAHQVVVLDRGQVAERGTHAELLEGGGLYAELYRRQLLQELA